MIPAYFVVAHLEILLLQKFLVTTHGFLEITLHTIKKWFFFSNLFEAKLLEFFCLFILLYTTRKKENQKNRYLYIDSTN